MTRTQFVTQYPHMNYIHSDITNVTILQTDTPNNLMLFSCERPNHPTETGFQYMTTTTPKYYYIFSILGVPILVKNPNP